jgi:hypothetical protein
MASSGSGLTNQAKRRVPAAAAGRPPDRVRLSEGLGVSLLTLRQMLDVRGRDDPSVFTVLVDRNSRRWKLRLRKCPNRHDNEILAPLEAPIDGGAALRTEPKGDVVAFVADPHILV